MIREGKAKGELVDFSETSSELFLEKNFIGLKKVFDAMVEGKATVCLSFAIRLHLHAH